MSEVKVAVVVPRGVECRSRIYMQTILGGRDMGFSKKVPHGFHCMSSSIACWTFPFSVPQMRLSASRRHYLNEIFKKQSKCIKHQKGKHRSAKSARNVRQGQKLE